ncbi:MAG: ROK family protein [Solirubrobacteraceae bacterium]
MGLVGGVETGGSWCVCAVGSCTGEIVARQRLRTTTPEETLAAIISFFKQAPPVARIGVGSFGPVDLDPHSATWGYVMATPKPGWRHTSVARTLEQALKVKVVFETDVAAAAVGEHRWGAGRGVGSLTYMTVGTGIGVGLLLGQEPWHGISHPEVGHVRVPHDRSRDPFTGTCPYHGDCLEGLACGLALAARWGRPAEQLGADHPAWELEAEYIAAGLANLVFTVAPERIVLGGGVLAAPGLLELVRTRLEELLGGYIQSPALAPGLEHYLVAPGLGDDAGVLGAMALACQSSAPETPDAQA